MLDNLINLDKKLFLVLNHFATPGMDPVMRFITGPIPWIFFFIGFLIVLERSEWKQSRTRFFIMAGSIILVFVLTEQSSVHLFKEVFMRLRPCHDPSLAGQVRLAAKGCGGQYGFVSTHAANSFGLATLSSLLLRRRWFTISVFAWALIVNYSRIYLGVHYPGDVLCGMILGCLIGLGMYFITNYFLQRKAPSPPPISTSAHQ